VKRALFIPIPCAYFLGTLLSLILPATGADLLVFNTDDSGPGSLRQAINDNNTNGGRNTVIFSNSVTGTITLTSGELVIGTNLVILGPGADVLTVNGNNSSRVFNVTGGTVAISGLGIISGRATAGRGGGLYNDGNLIISDCLFSANHAVEDGGAVASSGNLTVERCAFVNNQAESEGGALYISGSAVVNNSTIVSNNAIVIGAPGGIGGGIWTTGSGLTMSGCTIVNNNANSRAGGIFGLGSGTIIRSTIIAGNNASTGPDANGSFTSGGYNLIGVTNGGSGWVGLGDQFGTSANPLNPNLRPLGFHGGPTPTMPPLPNSIAIDQGKSFGSTMDQRGRERTYDDPNVFNATLGDGTDVGAVEAKLVSSPLMVSNTNDAGAGSLRQAIFRSSSFEFDYITFASNVTDTIRLTSGELVVNKPLSIKGPGINWFGGPGPRKLTISGNNASRVFRLSGGELSLWGLTIADGLEGNGGGILIEAGRHFITDCHIVSNTAALSGGGLSITSGGRLNIENSSITHNRAVYSGGGVACDSANTIDIFSCTISSNRTTHVFDGILVPRGGGIALAVGQFVFVTGSTIAGNVSTYAGGGIDNTTFSPARAFIENSIIADNTAPNFGPDVAGPLVSSDYNLVGNTNGSTGFSSYDQLNVNPLLGPLADYGGPTPTMALRVGSPAIDRGKSSSVTDQRGFARIVDDPNIPNANGGDGSDIGSFEADTNFRIVELHAVGSDVALSLSTMLGQSYRVEYTNNFAPGNWAILTNNAPGNGGLLWVTNYGGANQSQRFYRGAIVP